MRKLLPVILTFFTILPPAFAARKTCIQPKDARSHVDKKVCVAAHIYRVVDSGEEAHFLDVCSPETPNKDCRFFILSFTKDKKSIQFLHRLTGRDIQIRGKIRTIQGRAEIVLSDPNQLTIAKETSHSAPHASDSGPDPNKDFSAGRHWRAFRPRNGRMGQHGVHFSH